jgi:hypothetical protein
MDETPKLEFLDGVSATRWSMSFPSLAQRAVSVDYARRVENAKAQFAAAKAKRERRCAKRMAIKQGSAS